MDLSSHKALLKAAVFSAAVHLGLIILFPAIRISPLKPELRVISVKLLPLGAKKPKKIRKKRSVSRSKKRKPADYAKSQITGSLIKRKALPQVSRLTIPQLSPIPARLSDNDLTVAQGDLFGEENLASVIPDHSFSPVKFDDKEHTPIPQENLESKVSSDPRISWGKGEVREYLYRPDPPEYYSRVEGDIKIKFWVDRNGNVTQALPLMRLDGELEQISIDFIKKWRFTSLKQDRNGLQWGIITLKFQHN
ncbi:MAG: energy transducer TonB [bacterium]